MLDLLFPIECLGCGAYGQHLCDRCFLKIKLKDAQHCSFCRKERLFGQVCAKCAHESLLDGCFCAGDYFNPLLRSAVQTLKYSFVKNLVHDLALFLNIAFKNELKKAYLSKNSLYAGKSDFLSFLEQKPIVIPVPLSIFRFRWRGFNQAEEIARYFTINYNLKMRKDILVKVKNKKPQARLDKASRLDAQRGLFKCVDDDLCGVPIILVDDVRTTGATLEGCALSLKQANAGMIWAVTVVG